jgi:uncharacterized protein
MTTNHGKFVWYDVMTSDCKAAQTFYQNVIGWTGKDAGMADRPYTLFSTGPAMVAGMMPIPEEAVAHGARPCWTGYIGVDDVDDCTARIRTAGGAVQRVPEEIPGIGRFAVVADPHGAVFIIFKGTSEEAPPSQPAGTLGHVGWHELQAGNLDAAFAFYSGLFGWTKAAAMDMGPLGTYQLFAVGGTPVGGMMTKLPEAPRPFWLYYFNVDAVDAAMNRVKAGGGQVIHGPTQVPGGSWITQCVDPQNAMFALVGNRL